MLSDGGDSVELARPWITSDILPFGVVQFSSWTSCNGTQRATRRNTRRLSRRLVTASVR
jgi:hypothetical protein